MKEDKGNNKIVFGIIVLIIAIFVMILVNILISLQEKPEDKPLNEMTTEEQIDAEIKKLQSMEEYDRIKYYFDKYITLIENGQYEQAYNLLYPEFRNTYFPTLDSYTKYVTSKYPAIIMVQYTDVIRLGKYYVLDITFVDTINITADSTPGFTQKIILYENNWNDFSISFQAE